MNLKGQVTIPLVVGVSLIATSVGWVSQYFTQVSMQSAALADVRQTTALNTQTNKTQDEAIRNINMKLDKINDNITLLLISNGVKPR